ncbi:MAG: PotD/PotF family extracellular solute-binding protein, partial [Candidatus Nanohaloarchaea archaeon]
GDGGGGDGGGGGQATTKRQTDLAPITFMQWGGAFGEAARKVLKEPFEEEFGVKVNQVPLPTPSGMLSKLQAGNANFDLVSHWDFTLYRGVKADLFQEIDLDKVPNVRDRVKKSFNPKNVQYDPGSAPHHVPYSVSGWGLTYNTEKMDKPDSWDVLLTDKLDGKVSNSSWMSGWLGQAAKHAGVPFSKIPENIDQIWDMIKKYDKQSYTWWGSGQQMEKLLTNGSAWAGSFWFARTYRLRTQNDVPVRYTVPKEGTAAWIETYTIPKGVSGAKRRTALQFMNYINREEVQERFGKALRYAFPYNFKSIPDGHIYADHPELPLIGTDRLEPMHQKMYNSHYNQYSSKFQQV